MVQVMQSANSKPDLYVLCPDNTVLEAVSMMTAHKIGAILVMQDGKLVGIFSERDLLTRVVAHDLSVKNTQLNDVMTADVKTISPATSATDALKLMKEIRCRHLPVLDGSKVVAMVSVRDLYDSVCHQLEDDIKQKEHFIFGGGY